MRADAVEGVFALGGIEEGRHPVGALIDTRLGLQGDGAGAACALVVAVAWAWCADFGASGALEAIDAALGKERRCQALGLCRG